MLNKSFIFLINFIFIKISIKLFLILITIKNTFQNECEKSAPIKKPNNECYLTYCTQLQFEQEECIISNSIIKTQWLTNIIKIGNNTFRFVNFALSSDNNLFLQSTAYPSKKENYFFGIKSNGRPYFITQKGLTEVILLSYPDASYNARYNGEFINIITNVNNNINDKKEYLMSIGKGEHDCEFFNLDNYEVSVYTTLDMTKYNIRSKRFSLLHLSENNQNSYVFAFIGNLEDNNNNNFLVLQKYQFVLNSTMNRVEYSREDCIKKDNLDKNNIKYIISCYQTEKQIIVCFYYNSNLYYTATLFDSNLIELNSFDFEQPSTQQHLYFECIHLKKEVGIFYYFLGEIGGIEKPKIDIVEFIKDTDNINYKRNYKFKSLTTKKDNLKDSIYFNSIIKLSDDKFGIVQITNNREQIYIITYHIYNNDKEIVARYYTIDLFKLYNIKVAHDLDSILFNSFFVSSFCFCPADEPYENCTNYYSSVIMFSYPDSKDFEINLLNHFQEYNYTFPLDDIIKNKTKIDNNIFGLIIKGIKIQLYSKNSTGGYIISLYSNQNKKIIEPSKIIDKNDKIDFFFPLEKLTSNAYYIEYASVVTESSYDNYNSYCEVDYDNGNIDMEKEDFKKSLYVGKSSYISLYLFETLINNCSNIDCFYCLESDQNDCKLYKKPIKEENLDEKELTIIYDKLKEIINEKSFNGENIIMDMKGVLMQLSSVDFQEDINNENSSNVILGKCKDRLKEKYNLKDSEILLMLKLDLFKQNSSIPLVEYEVYNYNNSQKLNLKYCDDITIDIYVPIKLDNRTLILYNNLNSSGYDLFDSNDSFYNDICSIYTTINGTDITLLDRQKEYYNYSLLFCEEEGCTYDYYDSTINKVKCNCPISKTSKKEEGKDNNDEENNGFISTIVEIYNNKEKIKQIFSLSIKNMNFKVMKCFQLVFNIQYLLKNIGSILLSILIILYLILMVLYFIFGNKFIKEIIADVISKSKSISSKKPIVKFKGKKEYKNNKVASKKIFDFSDKHKNKIEKLKQTKTFSNNNNNNQRILHSIEDRSEPNNKDEKKFVRKKTKIMTVKMKNKLKINCPPPKLDKKPSLKVSKNILMKSKTLKENAPSIFHKNIYECVFKDKNEAKKEKVEKEGKEVKVKLSLKESNRTISLNNSEMILNKKNSIINPKNKKLSRFNNKEKKDKEGKEAKETIYENKIQNLSNIQSLNDEELNRLDYGAAVKVDKRTFLQYYWSLLKKKQLLLFTFYPSKDYNMRIIKMSFFIISFSLYMTINGFFFTDSTMHKVYEDNGNFNIIYQIPQILYSTLVSMTINKLLKYLSLSEKNILELKKQKNMKAMNDKSPKIEKCLKIKLLIYFVLGFLLMLFFWYFISTFCAVYSKTQYILIKNTLISFSISMIYPFGYSILPGIIRIPALRAKNQDQEFLYKFSQIIALI